MGTVGDLPESASDTRPQLTGVYENGLYLVPALLFTGSNNLVFPILERLEPGTMSMIWNLKIVWTAILLRCIGRHMSRIQIIGILILTAAVFISQYSFISDTAASEDNDSSSEHLTGVVLCLIAVTLVSFANVSCEYVYKRTCANQHRQYIRLYSSGVVLNAMCLTVHSGAGVWAGNLFEGCDSATPCKP